MGGFVDRSRNLRLRVAPIKHSNHEVLGNHSLTISAKSDGVGACVAAVDSEVEQLGLPTRIATTEGVSLCADERLAAYLEVERATWALSKP